MSFAWRTRHKHERPMFVGRASLAVALLSVLAVVMWHGASSLSSFCTNVGRRPRWRITSPTVHLGGKGLLQRTARGGYQESEGIRVGDSVEAFFEADGEWYLGRVEQDRGDGTFVVKWDDPEGGPESSICDAQDVKLYSPKFALSQLVVGQKYKGIVQGTATYGVFVDIGAEVTGLVHISAVREGFIQNLNDEVRRGQEVDVWVKSTRDFKLSLTMVDPEFRGDTSGARGGLASFADLPWHERLTGTVVQVRDFGVLVDVAPPEGGPLVTGLVHVSEMSDTFVEDPYTAVEIGQQVSVYVKDTARGKLSLSMKSRE